MGCTLTCHSLMSSWFTPFGPFLFTNGACVCVCVCVCVCADTVLYGILGVQSYRRTGNLLTDPKCHFGKIVSQECARKTTMKYTKQNGFHGTHTTFFYYWQ